MVISRNFNYVLITHRRKRLRKRLKKKGRRKRRRKKKQKEKKRRRKKQKEKRRKRRNRKQRNRRRRRRRRLQSCSKWICIVSAVQRRFADQFSNAKVPPLSLSLCGKELRTNAKKIHIKKEEVYSNYQ